MQPKEFDSKLKTLLNTKPINKNTAMKKKYTISPHTLFDEDEKLFYTKMGVEGKHMPLHYTVWGKSENESRERANVLAEILTAHLKPN